MGTDLGQTWFALCSSNYISPLFWNIFLILRIRRKLNSKKDLCKCLSQTHTCCTICALHSWSIGEVYSKAAFRIALILANRSISVLLCGSLSSPCDTVCTEQKIAVTNIHMDLPALQCVSNVRDATLNQPEDLLFWHSDNGWNQLLWKI